MVFGKPNLRGGKIRGWGKKKPGLLSRPGRLKLFVLGRPFGGCLFGGVFLLGQLRDILKHFV